MQEPTHHLSSSSTVTDKSGIAIQHLEYLPYGEVFIDDRCLRCLWDYNTPYTFSAKEQDEETDYHYFGARYYNSELGVFLSVDPLADASPSLSPYTYCSNNPVNRIDPTGMLDTDFGITASGNVKQISATNNDPNRLFALNDNGTKNSSITPITVTDKTILPELAKNRKQVQKVDAEGTIIKSGILRHASSRNKKDMANIYLFATQNSNAEWGIYSSSEEGASM